MARFHVSTNTPTKLELMAEWLPKQAWAAAADGPLHTIGSFHLDDPDGEVGMQTHFIEACDTLLQVPLTYRAVPLEGAEDALVGEMQHSVLRDRFVYDALGDPQYLLMLGAVTLLGYGQALGTAEHGGRRYAVPSEIKLAGVGSVLERVAVDGFEATGDDPLHPTFRNDRFELTLHRQPTSGSYPSIGLTGTWDGNETPVVLAEAREL